MHRLHKQLNIINIPGTNIGAWKSFLDYANLKYKLIDNIDVLTEDNIVVLPGVGNAKKYQKILKEINAKLNLSKLRKLLGICAGFQNICKYNEESNDMGIGLLELQVKSLTNKKVYNTGMKLFKGEKYYYNHSYGVYPINSNNLGECILNPTYGSIDYIDIENIIGLQFHPELSGDSGVKLINKIIKII